jgi:hypothetical protein
MLSSAEAVVRVVGAQPMDSWGLWCRFVLGVVVGGGNDCVVVGVGTSDRASCLCS